MAQTPQQPTHPASSPNPVPQGPPVPPSGRTAQSQSRRHEEYPPTYPTDRPQPGQPGSQRLSGPAGAGTDIGPVPERPGMIRPQPQDRQSIFEQVPGQQIPGRPAHPGHEPDRQHLRGRTVAVGSAEEDSEEPPIGVPTRAIAMGRMGMEEPDAPELPETEMEREEGEAEQRERPVVR